MQRTMFLTRRKEGFGVQIDRLALNRNVSLGGIVGVYGQRIQQAGKTGWRKSVKVPLIFFCEITRFSRCE